MKINPIISANNFGRAFTTTEKASYKKLVNDVKNELNINDTTAIVFDFNVPSEKGKNTGIGTTFSNEMLNFTSFLKDMVGINSIQLQPQGKITKTNMSPYSGTNFALGEHIIDLQKLTTEDYSCLLTENDIKEADENYKQDKLTREYKTDYAYVLGTSQNNGIQEILLKKAYENFKTNGSEKLNKEFSQFKKENNDWLEKNSLFEALSTEYKTQDITKWKDLDKNLYLSSTKHEERESRIFQIKNKYSDLIDFEDFKQFLAYKQQKESKEILNSENIKIYGDCLIGFSRSEMWSNIDCFKENWYYGGPDPNCSETNNIQTWNLPALDYTQLGECDFDGDISKLGKTGKFLYDKYSTFFKRYDGIRMDAAWQFVTPFIYEQKNGNYQQVNLPEINFTIFNIMKAAAKNVYKENFDKENPNNIMLELVGLSAGKSRELTLNSYPHLYTTAYAEYDETPKKFLDKGYKNGKFYVGVSNHDNDSLVNMSRNEAKRTLHTKGIQRDYNLDFSQLKFDSENYKKLNKREKIEEDYRNVKFAEIFTSKNQFFTLPDMFGMEERINISGKVDKNNWSVRIPNNYEEFYYSQLSKGFGLNLAKALQTALIMNNSKNENLIKKCKEASEILRSDGALTELDANKSALNGEIKDLFSY